MQGRITGLAELAYVEDLNYKVPELDCIHDDLHGFKTKLNKKASFQRKKYPTRTNFFYTKST
jgi:hypothetical protein